MLGVEPTDAKEETKTSETPKKNAHQLDQVKTTSVKSSKEESAETPAIDQRNTVFKLKAALTVFIVATVGLLIGLILVATTGNQGSTKNDVKDSVVEAAAVTTESSITTIETKASNVPDNVAPGVATIFSKGKNICENMNPNFPNVDCVHLPGPQAGANVTKGYVGGMNVSVVPNTKNYWQSSMCAVNVHWHLGTEHYSVGEYDEFGSGPQGNADAPALDDYGRKLAGKDVRGGYRCHHYDEKDPKFTTKFDWKHCQGMIVGETYEVHWPHSAAGACGEVNQYQTPFYDGVFCKLPLETFKTLGPQDIASAVGVQGQIFTVVNDESYFYPDLMRGWIVDGDYGKDIHYYTGSTTGTSRNNEICSQYTPITWQVDRKCHLISASSFDKLCYDMKQQRDDMSYDLHAHGSRVLVADKYVANNQQRRLRRLHDHTHGHDHDHDHEWF